MSELSLPVQRLISTLSNLGLTSREIAEAIWLAGQTEDREIIDIVATIVTEDSPPPDDEIEDTGEKSAPLELGDTMPSQLAPAEIIPAPVEKTSSLALPPNYQPIPVPDAPAISQALLLARALRPLARQIAVGLATMLDEAATVDRIAETGLWQPVLKPESELWLDVALIFDTSPSMCLWQRLGSDIYRLVSRYGEFRDVRLWQLKHRSGQVDLTTRNGVTCRPKELLIGDRRRLIVIVSDCVAPAWHNGKMRELIATWSAKLPTVVFHVFPDRLWSRTALSRSVTVELQGKQEGLPSDRLKPFARSVWDRDRVKASLDRSHVRLPVVTLEPDTLASWAKVVVGDRRSRTLGIVWDAAPATLPASVKPTNEPADLKARIDAFLLLSSPISRQLAGLLSSAPVITLPIVRLIKQSMLSQASAVHIAEVMMSGLFKVSGTDIPTFENAERIVYETVDEQVRDRLRAGSQVGGALDVYSKVSDYIAQGLGRSVNEFWALLRVPTKDNSFAETDFLKAFATVSAKILRGLGSEFDAIANSLAPPSIPGADFPTDNDQFPPPLVDLEYEVAKLIDFPALQTCEYESATITAILDRFDFETAQVKQQNRLLGLRREWKIDRRQATTWGYTEILSSDARSSGFPTEKGHQDSESSAEIGLDMVAISGGSFLMGSPTSEPESRDSERPQHQVTLQPFYLGRYPITQAQWREVASYPQIERKLKPDPSEFKGANLSVENVYWADAQEFCQRLSAKTGKNYRLPSEAQWEYAARAGSTTPFHYGETITPELANYNTDQSYQGSPTAQRRGRTTSVGSFPANEWGLYDMHGNVWEWCEDDWHDNYNGAPTDGSAWVEADRSNTYRLLRGGAWSFNPHFCRSAIRYFNSRDDIDDFVGFRVCCVPSVAESGSQRGLYS